MSIQKQQTAAGLTLHLPIFRVDCDCCLAAENERPEIEGQKMRDWDI